MPAHSDASATLPLSLRSSDGLLAGFERKPCLVVVHGSAVEIVPLEIGAPLVLGRESPAEIVCQSPFLSRRHASFTLLRTEGAPSTVSVRDLGSKNGVYLGRKAETEVLLGEGQSVRLGPVRVSFQLLDGEERALRILGHDGFAARVAEEIVRAETFKHPFAVLHLRPISSNAAIAQEGVLAPFVRTLLRPVDKVAVYGPSAVEALLPETTAEAALAAAHSLAAAHRAGLSSLVVGIATYPACRSADALLESSRKAAMRADATRPVMSGDGTHSKDEDDDDDGFSSGGIVGESASMKSLLAMVGRVARSNLPVLILGETGSGKEVVARRLHQESARKGRLVSINCAAIAPNLVESTLFGHEKGAFTGAIREQRGIFEAAQGGTVFLDEIGELSTSAQAALLRTLETRTVVRVGSTADLHVDVRVVAATHRDLEQMSQTGAFRDDLFFRLNSVVLEVAPLRSRPADIEPLARLFLAEMRKAGQTKVRGFEESALQLLRDHGFPGNVRELRNAVERAAVIAAGPKISALDLPDRIAQPSPSSNKATRAPARSPGETEGRGYDERMQIAERQILLDAIDRSGGKQEDAAAYLQMPLRTFKYRLQKLGIKKSDYS